MFSNVYGIVNSVNCSIYAQAYAWTTDECNKSGNHQQIGIVTLNNVTVWKESFCHGRWPMNRGVTIIDINPFTCTVNHQVTFDTNHHMHEAEALANYLLLAREKAVFIGVTGDEPTDSLTPALSTLAAAGVRVDELEKWGSFTFVMQKGFPHKTVISKVMSNSGSAASMSVEATGDNSLN